ncbi:MAG: hypothetical protein HFE64_08805 [Lachnospiraceae bacterium]|jgi:hypothetical protein|nr:hypothetical protein [Lachnospiraceae bacterium]
MFGYVIANMEKLSAEQQAHYKGCYCGLCHELARRYGRLSRLILSYDMVFLILVRSAAAKLTAAMEQERCVAHPQKPHYFWTNAETQYAADMSVLLAYYQAEDDWQDDQKVMALGQRRMLRKAFLQVQQAYPEIGESVRKSLAALSELEKSGRLDPDTAALCFGQVMAVIFAGPEKNAALSEIGLRMGKWIYIMDACLDRKEDLKKERYNPLPALPVAQFETILNCLMADCVKAVREAELEKEWPILENILYSGVWTRFEAWKKESGHEGSV